jgi:prefoldin beta subunit
MASATASDNPGNVLASAVDAEVAKFRVIQEEVAKLRSDLQFVLGQRTENELVQHELELISDSSPSAVYKKIGPVLIKQDLDEAKETVKKRIEYIGSEKEKMEARITSKENEGNDLARRVQQMQAQLQQTTAEAVRAIGQQHSN